MKEKFFALLTGTLGFLSPALAQYVDLMNDRNISWVAEYTTDFALDPVTYTYRFFEDNYESKNELNIIELRILPTTSGLYHEQDLERYFGQQIFTAIREGTFALFEDETLETPMPKETLTSRLIKVDTVITDMDDYDGMGYQIVRNDLTYSEIVAFRVRQGFYFNQTEKKFGSRILALAPLLDKKDYDGNFLETVPLVWLKIENPPKNWDKTLSGGFPYSFETKMKGNAPEPPGFVIKKGRMDFLTLIVNEVAKPSHRVFDKYFEPIDPAKLQGYVLSTDTVSTFNPETYEEKIEIIQRNAIKDVERISFVQHWFFDDRKKMLVNRIVAVAPLIAVKDTEGNFQYSKPLFYIMNE